MTLLDIAKPAPIILTVIGVPASQGSKVKMPNGAMLDGTSSKARAALKDWRRAVADQARAWRDQHPGPPLAEPVRLTVTFRFAPVASDPYRTLHATYPDLSKIVRSTEDALVQSALLADDRRIVSLVAEKRYCGPGESAGCTIEVELLGWYEHERRSALKAQAAMARRQRL